MTPSKFPRTPHLPFSPEIHADDKTHEEPAVLLGREVVITEKLDGGNCCLWRGQTFGRSTALPAIHPSFSYVKAHHAPKTVDEPFCFYGENLQAVHSIVYDGLADFFWLFAILDNSTWLAWDDVVAMAARLRFETVPVRYRGVFQSLEEMRLWMDARINERSALGSECEGFVVRLAGCIEFDRFHMSAAKYVRQNHVQSDVHWSNRWSQAELAGGAKKRGRID